MLVLDGTERRGRTSGLRFRVYFDGDDYWLRSGSFSLLVRLAVARQANHAGGGWLRIDDLHVTSHQIYCLCQDIPVTVERCDRRIRLVYNPKRIMFKHRRLAKSEDHRIASLFGLGQLDDSTP